MNKNINDTGEMNVWDIIKTERFGMKGNKFSL